MTSGRATREVSEWSATALVRDVQLSPTELARFLRLSAPAYQRCVAKDGFTRDHRSKLLRLATVLDRAQRVLGDRTHATYWVTNANRALNFSVPLALIETKSGTDRVYGVLLRIEDGHFA